MNPTVGLIVNPIAGIGGPAALKGSDSVAIQRLAVSRGAVARSSGRAEIALRGLASAVPGLTVLTAPRQMGADAAMAAGIDRGHLHVISQTAPVTSGADTARAADLMRAAGVRLILFVGGDGTAHDICRAIGDTWPALGIPAGVKMHSAVFAVSPAAAANVASSFLCHRLQETQPREVMDIDEEAARAGRVSAALYGYLSVPYEHRFIQSRKLGSNPAESNSLAGIAAQFVSQMKSEFIYVLGPGTTTRAVADLVGVNKTLMGVDVVSKHKLLAADVTESGIERIVTERTCIVVSPIGGQGFLFGRGNQQIGPAVLRRVGGHGIAVLCSAEKLAALRGNPLLVDTGDPKLDRQLAGHIPVITGYRQRSMYPVRASWD
jgi:predicted polyphosphate/ATP-dependent NAD kinase